MTIPNYPQLPPPRGQSFRRARQRGDVRRVDSPLDGGLGGCRDFRIEDFDEDVRPYILAYLEGDLDSVAITYAAMRTKELELT